MEQLSGSVGSWMPMSLTTRPGMLKGYSLQAIAHGADAVVHFRWRTAVSGAEMYWHGIIDHSNVPGRRYKEFCGLCDEVKKSKILREQYAEMRLRYCIHLTMSMHLKISIRRRKCIILSN